MTCEEIREDLEAYALGALDEADARRVQSHIQECDDCARLFDAYRQTVEYLAFTAPLYHASPRLKDRVMGGIGASRPALAVQAVLRRPWVLASAALVLLGFAVGGMVWAATLSAEVNRLRNDNLQLAALSQLDSEQRSILLRVQRELTSARTEQQRISSTLDEQAKLLLVALDPDLLPTELQGTNLAPQAKCNYVWSTKQTVGALTCKDLPNTAFALNYELWGTKGEKTVPLGAFMPRNDGTANMLVRFPVDAEGPVTNLWVTLEQQNSNRSRPSPEVVLQRIPSQQAAR